MKILYGWVLILMVVTLSSWLNELRREKAWRHGGRTPNIAVTVMVLLVPAVFVGYALSVFGVHLAGG